ncbi:hypothetical protein [Ancylobacter terrae]|uniref:hypothetical protein n=1 Tax=Ancylobacter sp. sgz301288 TaxID=3342077 RepID=UPI003859C89C
MRRISDLELIAAALFAGLAAPAAAEQRPQPYRPVPATIGAALTPPADLVAVAQRLGEAARAGDDAAVAARIADRLVFVIAGITPASARKAKTEGPWRDGPQRLEAIGGYFMEGDLPPAPGVDPGAAHIAQALSVIADAIATPEWGRDPLVKDAICTYRGARWDAGAAARIDAGARGLYAPAAAKVHASASENAAIRGTLEPERIYLEETLDGLPDGWRGVRLPSGAAGAVRESDVRDPAVWGLCFRRGPAGEWKVAAFSTALL